MPNGKQRAARRDRAPRRHTAATAAEPETTAVERLIAHCEEVVQAFAATLEDSTAKGRRDAGILRELAEIRQRLLAPLRLANLRSDVAAECETWPNRDRVAEVIEQAIDALGRLASDDPRLYPMERGPDGATQVRVTVDEYVSTREDWLEEKHGFLLPAIDSLRGLARPAVAAPRDDGSRENRATWLAKAMLFVRDYPEWTNAKIAREAGVHPATLCRCPEYQAAASIAREQRKTVPKGRADGSGGIEAEAPADSVVGEPVPGSRRGLRRERCAGCNEWIGVAPDMVGQSPLCERCQD
jgi:hypothetical protein